VSYEDKTAENWFQMGFHSEYPEDKIKYYSMVFRSEQDPLIWDDEAIALVWTN
jgi:hypothetical protein